MRIASIGNSFDAAVQESMARQTERMLQGNPYSLVKSLGERFAFPNLHPFPLEDPALEGSPFGLPTPLGDMKATDHALVDYIIAKNRARGVVAYVKNMKEDVAIQEAMMEAISRDAWEQSQSFIRARLEKRDDATRYLEFATKEAVRSGWKYMKQLIMAGRDVSAAVQERIVSNLLDGLNQSRQLPMPQLQRLNTDSLERLAQKGESSTANLSERLASMRDHVTVTDAPKNIAAEIAAYANQQSGNMEHVAHEIANSISSAPLVEAPRSTGMALVAMATMQTQAAMVAAAPVVQAATSFEIAVKPYINAEKQIEAVAGALFSKTG